MKILKHLIVLAIILFSNCTGAQNINKLSIVEYNSIEINGTNIADISYTRGSVTKMNTLFGFSFTYKAYTEPSSGIELWNDAKGVYFVFEDDSIYSFEISNNQSNITLKGTTVTIGDNISKLGNVKISNTNEIDFGTDQTSDVLTIKFDTVTKKITNIEYTYFN